MVARRLLLGCTAAGHAAWPAAAREAPGLLTSGLAAR